MSLNTIPLKVCKVVDPLVDMQKLSMREYGVVDAGLNISYQNYIAQNISNSTIQITSMPPSENTIISPEVYAKVKYRLTFTGTTGSGNLLQLGQWDAPRAFPFSDTVTTMQATINGQSISVQLNQWFKALMQFGGERDDRATEFSSTPEMLDTCSNYDQIANTNRSPFRAYADNVLENSRGGFSGISVVSNSATGAVVELEVYEPLFLPLFYYSKNGMSKIRTLSWLFTFGDLNRVWSRDAVTALATSTNVISSLVTNITGFELWYKFITPKSVDSIPRNLIYNYNAIVPNVQNYGSTVAAGAQVQITLNSLNLQSIPKRLYIYVTKANQTYSDADAFFRIDNLNINFMNRNSLLASAPIQALYQINKENGYIGSWDQYNKFGGAPVCIDIAKNLGLLDLEAPGMLTNPQLTILIKATNISNQTIQPIAYCQVMYEGVANIADGQLSLSTAVVSSQDVLKTQLQTAEVVQMPEGNKSFYGGDLMSDGVKFVKALVDGVTSGVSLGAQILPMVGLGEGRRKKKGGSIIGGQLIDRSELQSRLDAYE